MNFIKLRACNEDGKEAGYIFVLLPTVNVIERLAHCTRIIFAGGYTRLVKEEPEDIISAN
jgi:hypothetical protein